MLSLKLCFGGDWGETVLSFLSAAPEWKVKRPKAIAEMMCWSMPLNNSTNGTKEFDRADTEKQMKGNSTVH